MDYASPPERLSIVEREPASAPARRAVRPGDPLAPLLVRLCEHGRDPSVEQAVELGRLIIAHLYDGELGRWRDRGPKHHSLRALRALADRAGRPVSSSALYRSIALFELSEGLGGVEPWTAAGLGVSHLRLVLGLPAAEQRRLLDLAAARGWTVTELEREAAAARGRSAGRASRGGRPRTPRFAKTIAKLAKLAAGSDDLFGDLDAIAEMDAERVAELQAALATVQLRCQQLAARIERSSPAR